MNVSQQPVQPDGGSPASRPVTSPVIRSEYSPLVTHAKSACEYLRCIGAGSRTSLPMLFIQDLQISSSALECLALQGTSLPHADVNTPVFIRAFFATQWYTPIGFSVISAGSDAGVVAGRFRKITGALLDGRTFFDPRFEEVQQFTNNVYALAVNASYGMK